MLAELIFAQIICQMGFFQFTTQTTPFLALFVCVHAVCLRSISISSIFLWSFPPPKGEIFGWYNGTTLLCENKGTYSTFPHSTHPLFFHASWTEKQTKVGSTDILMHVSLAYNEHKCIKNACHLKLQK